MANSTEYPDLKFVEAKSWERDRNGKSPWIIVIHYTAGSERSTSAEDGAAYDQRRTDGVSTQYFVDRNSVVQCVLTKHRAHSARRRGNDIGIHYELCGTAQTRAQWLDEASLATLKLTAKQVARDCKKYDIPVRRLTVAQTRAAWYNHPNGPKGIVGHVDCTLAFPEDGGDHTDPGKDFPWDVFLNLVRKEMSPPAPPQEWSDMATRDEIKQAFREVLQEVMPYTGSDTSGPRARITAAGWSSTSPIGRMDYLAEMVMAPDTIDGKPGSIMARVDRIEGNVEEILARLPDPNAPAH